MDRSRRTLLAAAIAGFAMAAVSATPAAPRVVRIRARRFQFTPSVVRLKKGEPVVLELATDDVFMGFNAPDFKLRGDIVPGQTTKLALTPDKAGEFAFICDVFCGDGHESMGGQLVVT